MKKIINILVLLTFINCYGNNLTKIDKLLIKISKKRVGIDINKSNEIKDPFYKKNKINYIQEIFPKEEKQVLKLNAIFNNKVKINNKWYKCNDSIKSYEIIQVSINSVTLKDEQGNIKTINIHKGIKVEDN